MFPSLSIKHLPRFVEQIRMLTKKTKDSEIFDKDVIQWKEVETLDDLEFQENQIISESDIQVLSTLTELQRQAKETAKINNIVNDQDEDEIKDEQNTLKKVQQTLDFTQIDNEPTFIDQMFYAEKAQPEIQEQDPLLRKQIQDALQVKSKFRIIKIQDVINNQNKLIADRDFKFAVEDETDMSNQLPKAKMAKQFLQSKICQKEERKIFLKTNIDYVHKTQFLESPHKLNFMRVDSLAFFLQLSGIRSNSNILMFDNTNGMGVAAIAERLDGEGTINTEFWNHAKTNLKDLLFNFIYEFWRKYFKKHKSNKKSRRN